MAFGFFWKSLTKIKRELTSKSYFWVRNSSFVLAPRYCRMSGLVFTPFCLQNVPKPELTSAARTMDRNSEKWSQKGYHSLSFAAKVSVWRSFEQFHSLNNRHQISRIIQFHHVSYTNERFFFTACGNTAAYCIIFLTVLELLTQAANFEDTKSL